LLSADRCKLTADSQEADRSSLKADSCKLTATEELLAWERFTLKRWGRSQPRSFEVRSLPEEVAFSVSAGLLAAGSPAEARQVFALARAELADRVPPPPPPPPQ